EEEENSSIGTKPSTPIGMKTVHIPIFPTRQNRNSRNTRMEEIQTSKIEDVITFSNFQYRKEYTHIEITFRFKEYKSYSFTCFIRYMSYN
ncbi:hypothetical protein J1N35_005394, partial [Gossypium stocksii]